MGNNLFSDDRVSRNNQDDEGEIKYLLQKDEISSIKSIFNAIYLPQQKLDNSNREKNIATLLGGNKSDLFSEICTYWLDAHIGTLDSFENFVVECTRISSKETIKKLLAMISEAPLIEVGKHKVVFFRVLLELCGCPGQNSEKVANKIVEFYRWLQKTHPSEDHEEFKAFFNFINKYLPFASKIFESHISEACMPSVLNSPSYSRFWPPSLSHHSSIVDHETLILLAMHNRHLQATWTRLYSTEIDGMSFNRVEHHILGYDGPTCILIKVRDSAGTVLGAFAMERWKEQNRFYGSSSNLLFSLHPKIRMYPSSGSSNGHYQWLNTRSFGSSLPHGLGFGGSTDGFRLFIPESLEGCTARANCLTYEPGRLLTPESSSSASISMDSHSTIFEIDVMEIWGTGGKDSVEKGLQAQRKSRALMDEAVRRAKQVDKAAFFDNEFDREFFLPNTFQHKANQADQNCV